MKGHCGPSNVVFNYNYVLSVGMLYVSIINTWFNMLQTINYGDNAFVGDNDVCIDLSCEIITVND